MIITGGVGLEGIYIFVLTYLIAIAVAVPIGAVLLLISGYFKLGRWASLVLFAIVIQGVAAIVVMFLFEAKLSQVPLQYGFVTLPATLAAWYFSVHHILNKGSG